MQLITCHNSALNPLPFPLPIRINNRDAVEMIAIHDDVNYTSLKDLIPVSPPSTVSPTCCRGDSWREIPIKDPLLQHAAWAYLQPMVEQRRCEDERWWRRFRRKFWWLFGCFNDVVLVVFDGWFSEPLMIKS